MRAWVAASIAFGAADLICHNNGWPTFSSATRHIFRTDTELGRSAFTASLAVGALWFHSHIIKEH